MQRQELTARPQAVPGGRMSTPIVDSALESAISELSEEQRDRTRVFSQRKQWRRARSAIARSPSFAKRMTRSAFKLCMTP
jgi:hypothetical protein